jgi:hypothetical protein
METAVSQPAAEQEDPHSSASLNGSERNSSEFMAEILQSLQTMKNGDFSVRLPVSWTRS